MRHVNRLLQKKSIKNVDYFSEVLVISKNMEILENSNSGPTSLKVVIGYLKSVILAKNIDKIKVVLDSRIISRCLNYMQTLEVHLRESLLDLILEATSSFSRDHLYLFEKYDINAKFDDVMDMKLRSSEEIQRNFGLIAHLALSKEDNMNKSNFKSCVRNYFQINSKICEKYLRQISLCIAVPSFVVSLVTTIKSKTEILRNKIAALKIIYNMTNGPFCMIQPLSHGTIDTWSTLGKILAKSRANNSNKKNEYLLPYALNIFRNIFIDCRKESLFFLKNVVGLRTLLREQSMIIPEDVSLARLAGFIDRAHVSEI